jgi:branched-subunit amino acid aminotransferase/4-amino-4-deoxychorismate lyase
MVALCNGNGKTEPNFVTEPIVYLNGEILPAAQAHLMIFDAGVVQGATVSEQARTFRHQLWRLDEHLDRLFHSLELARISLDISREKLREISLEIVAHNSRLLDAQDELGLIQFVTAGEYSTYSLGMGRSPRSAPTLCIHTIRLPIELWAKKKRYGTHLITPSVRQIPSQCVPPQMKCRSRMHYHLAEQEVRQSDPEASALLLDLQGNITETNAANFLMVEKGKIVSPPMATILPGISRAYVLELAAALGIPCENRPLAVTDALNADEAFLTSTPYCLMPVAKINGQQIGTSCPGPVYSRLLQGWSAVTGVDIGAQLQLGESSSLQH